MTSHKVIVFGPTGAVGSAAARTASELGAHVVLAMRDTSKPIPGLDAEQEKQGSFERVQADLTAPDTVRNAVTTTGAKHAFIYLAHGMPNGMKPTIEALKSAGIELVVFLSSFTIQGKLEEVPPNHIIPFVHAQVEINLHAIFGANAFVAARGGYFASNSGAWKAGLAKGEIKLYGPDNMLDNIVPEDIGRVCGTVLAKGPQDEKRIIYLYGPKLLSQRETARTLGRVLGKDPEIVSLDAEGAYKMFTEERGLPPPLAKDFVEREAKVGPDRVFGCLVGEEELLNVEKYSGEKATAFEEWAERNQGLFAA